MHFGTGKKSNEHVRRSIVKRQVKKARDMQEQVIAADGPYAIHYFFYIVAACAAEHLTIDVWQISTASAVAGGTKHPASDGTAVPRAK